MPSYSLQYRVDCSKCGNSQNVQINFPADNDEAAKEFAHNKEAEIGDRGANFRLYKDVDSN